MGIKSVLASITQNPPVKGDGKLLNGSESKFLMDWKATGGSNGITEQTEACQNKPGNVFQDFTCKMLLV